MKILKTGQKVTVVIPTRERPETLKFTIQTALNQIYPNLCVLISDNFSGPETKSVVDGFVDERLQYVNTGSRVNMSHNFEFALSHITEGWIVVIGDDDGLLPNSIGPVIAQLEASGLLALSSETCHYRWPEADPKMNGIMSVPFGKKTFKVNATDAIELLMDWKVSSFLLPAFYTGRIIHADVLNRIRDIDGAFFQSQVPDIYSSFAICSVIDEYLFSKKPFAVSGTSKTSNGVALFRLEKTAFLDEANIPFHHDLPMPEFGTLMFSMPAIVCECLLQSAHLRQKKLEISHQHMLELILAETYPGRDLLNEWAVEFARMHQLDLAAAKYNADHPPLLRRIAKLKMALTNRFSRYRTGGPYRRPISDVSEACIQAGELINSRPSLLLNHIISLKRLVN